MAGIKCAYSLAAQLSRISANNNCIKEMSPAENFREESAIPFRNLMFTYEQQGPSLV